MKALISLHSWPLNNMGLNCTGHLYVEFLSKYTTGPAHHILSFRICRFNHGSPWLWGLTMYTLIYAILCKVLECPRIFVSMEGGGPRTIPHGYWGTTVKFWWVQSYTLIFESEGVGAPNSCVVQGSTLYNKSVGGGEIWVPSLLISYTSVKFNSKC